MRNRRPSIKAKKNICIICEGYEEYDYLKKLIILGVWSENYKFVLVNAKSNGNIPARYQEKYSSDSYHIVLVFCDTDKNPYEDYITIKNKIDKIHGFKNASETVVMFVNPCTMQIMLLHFSDVKLKSHKKTDNQALIKKIIGIDEYQAHEKQRKRLNEKITEINYSDMKERASKLCKNDEILCSSNFYKYIVFFENKDIKWIEEINNCLEN